MGNARRITIPYAPREYQNFLHNSLKRWNFIVCHRRFGKTVWAINHLIRSNFQCNQSRPRFSYVAPLLKQAKAIAWDYLKHYSRPIPGISINETELRVDYPNGGRIRLFGSDNPDSLRGLYHDGIVFDEYAQIHPDLFPEVVRPALSDRMGWAAFMGTPAGRNHFWEMHERVKNLQDWFVSVLPASVTKLLPESELADAKAIMSADQYDQEYECSWTAAVKGSYYADEIKAIREKGQICNIPIEPSAPINTFWDLGVDDYTAIWLHQYVAREHRFVDYIENNGESLRWYVNKLWEYRDKGYIFGNHHMPHDARQRSLQDGLSVEDKALELGLRPLSIINTPDLLGGINQARNMLLLSWFDEKRCEIGIRRLESYRREWNSTLNVFSPRPAHDESSHGADAFRYFAQGYTPPMMDAGQYDIPVLQDY